MVLQFRGTAHPPPGRSDPDVANLSAAELSLTDLGQRGGLPLLYEHNSNDRIGRCQASWEGPNGELRVVGVIDDARIEQTVRSGRTQGTNCSTRTAQMPPKLTISRLCISRCTFRTTRYPLLHTSSRHI